MTKGSLALIVSTVKAQELEKHLGDAWDPSGVWKPQRVGKSTGEHQRDPKGPEIGEPRITDGDIGYGPVDLGNGSLQNPRVPEYWRWEFKWARDEASGPWCYKPISKSKHGNSENPLKVMMFGAPEWCSRLGLWLWFQLRLWFHGSWDLAPSQALHSV